MIFNYKLVFEKIESSLMRNLNIPPEEFKKRIAPFKEIKYWDFRNRTDKNIFWVLSYVVFFGQNDPAYLIERKFNEINKLLCDGAEKGWIGWEVDFNRLNNLSTPEKNKFITEEFKLGRWGSIKDTDFYGNKISGVNRYLKWIIENASTFSDVIRRHNNSFREYIKEKIRVKDLKELDLFEYDYRHPALNALFKDIRSEFSGFGDKTTYHFLGDLGFNVNKPDSVVCRILNRFGLIDSERDQENALIQIKKFAEETGNITRYIDIIFVKYGQKGDSPIFGTKSGICSPDPKCSMCAAKQYCNYSR